MNGKNSSTENNPPSVPEMRDSRGDGGKSVGGKERLAKKSEQDELLAAKQARASSALDSSSKDGKNGQPLDVDARRLQTSVDGRHSRGAKEDAKNMSSSSQQGIIHTKNYNNGPPKYTHDGATPPGAEAVSGETVPRIEHTIEAVVALDPQEEIEAAREEERRLAAEREEALRRRLEELEGGGGGDNPVVVVDAKVQKVDENSDEEGSAKRRIVCAIFCSALALGIVLLALWGSGVAFTSTSTASNNLMETPEAPSSVPTTQPSTPPTSQPSNNPSNQPTGCVAVATHCGHNPGSWEDFDELDCAFCCYGFHYFLRMSDRENKAYCREAPTVWDTPFVGTPDMAWCTVRSEHCGLNAGSWEDFDELDCADCCYGYHSYLDEDNQNKAYCMQDPAAQQTGVNGWG